MNEKIIKLAKSIKLLVLDVDGILTDGTIQLSANGDEVKIFFEKHILSLLYPLFLKKKIIFHS